MVASELGMLVEEAAATTVGAVSSVGLTEVAGRGGLEQKGREAGLALASWHVWAGSPALGEPYKVESSTDASPQLQ